jgi:undecaprenyl-diphosphatase
MTGRLEAYDLGMLYWFNSWRSPWLNSTLTTLTHLGDAITLVSVSVLGAGLLLWLRRPRLAAVLVGIGLLSWGLEWSVKRMVDRPRPDLAARLAEPPDNPSFPSGHALCSMAIYGTLALMLGRVRRRWTPWLLAAAVCLSLVIGLTRVMIGVHYPFDVLAGWLAGLLCLALAHALAGRSDPNVPPEAETTVARAAVQDHRITGQRGTEP